MESLRTQNPWTLRPPLGFPQPHLTGQRPQMLQQRRQLQIRRVCGLGGVGRPGSEGGRAGTPGSSRIRDSRPGLSSPAPRAGPRQGRTLRRRTAPQWSRPRAEVTVSVVTKQEDTTAGGVWAQSGCPPCPGAGWKTLQGRPGRPLPWQPVCLAFCLGQSRPPLPARVPTPVSPRSVLPLLPALLLVSSPLPGWMKSWTSVTAAGESGPLFTGVCQLGSPDPRNGKCADPPDF